MCGIFFSLGHERHIVPDARTEQFLRNRGPDKTNKHEILIPENPAGGAASCIHATFVSTVLALRGTHIIGQPLKDGSTQSVLCWNGEAWKINDEEVIGNDSQAVFNLLLKACSSNMSQDRTSSTEGITKAISSISGPFAFVFYDAVSGRVYFGRDCLGRRSLLRKTTSPDELIISSVCDNASGEKWEEIEADGIYFVNFNQPRGNSIELEHIPFRRRGEAEFLGPKLNLPFPAINRAVPEGPRLGLSLASSFVDQLDEVLRKSLNLRIQHVREISDEAMASTTEESRIAILFSGGLDCTVLARLSHDILPQEQSVDLLNVAFQNPRIHRSLEEGVSPYELCPDRITGRTSYAELQKVCPERKWRFIAINVPYTSTVEHRERVMSLMHPHNTEMDLSISYALYFASRGVGEIVNGIDTVVHFTSSARVLLSGLGADELFGGYQRHALGFSRKGYAGLIEELELDFNRLGKRNLGRDDRVISDSGREVRFPYLDEDFITWALGCPVWGKCGFGEEPNTTSIDPASALEPSKKVLRLLAWKLGMTGVAAEKKRAIQFGARTAKMESGRVKGTQALT